MKLQLGVKLTKGLGAGANPEVGKSAALEDTDQILEALDGADMVFITTGLGGGTGTGAAPIIASLAAELGALTVAVVTKPFALRGTAPPRAGRARGCGAAAVVDTLITIPNDKLLHYVEQGDFARRGVPDRGRHPAPGGPGHLGPDHGAGRDQPRLRRRARRSCPAWAWRSWAPASREGEHRAVEAAQRAISSPLLEDTSIDGAQGRADQHHRRRGYDAARGLARPRTSSRKPSDEDANIIFGTVIDRG